MSISVVVDPGVKIATLQKAFKDAGLRLRYVAEKRYRAEPDTRRRAPSLDAVRRAGL